MCNSRGRTLRLPAVKCLCAYYTRLKVAVTIPSSYDHWYWCLKSELFLFLLIFQLAILVLSPVIYYVWVNHWTKESGNILNISFFMSLSVCLYTCATCWLNICIYPINGIGKIKLQMYSSIVEMLLIIPIALWMGQNWGAPGIILAPVIVYIPRIIWAPIQLNKLIKNKATGIWNK